MGVIPFVLVICSFCCSLPIPGKSERSSPKISRRLNFRFALDNVLTHQLPTELLSNDPLMQTATYIKSGGEQTAHRR
jgi:hypothetical protein